MTQPLIEMGLAFLEGFALIVSPCILPVLPLILSTSVGGGVGRPYGIILGFVTSFTLFAWFSRQLVAALAIDLEYVKYGSLVLLGLMGLVLLSEALSAWFSRLTQGAANFGARLGSSQEGGFASGIGVGALIGLVWTPCAGPLLAAVLVQVIRQETDAQGLFVLLSFSIGVAVPMLLIALLGRRLVSRLGFFQRHAEAVRKTFGILILLAVAFIASGVDALTLFQTRNNDPSVKEGQMQTEQGLIGGVNKPYPAPEIQEIEHWLNSPPLTLEALKGKVVLIDFWTYSCINCVRTMPYITGWDKKYRDKGLVIIGVHAPEFAFEKKVENVVKAIEKYGITYPVALDNRFSTWRNFDNHYWPAHYLIDRSGNVVYTHFGEGEYARTEHNIRVLLGEASMPMEEDVGAVPFRPDQTPETYLGALRAERFVGVASLGADGVGAFAFPQELLDLHQWALSGAWRQDGEKIVAAGKGAALQLQFKARKVFLVMGTASGAPVKVSLMLNGKPDKEVIVTGNTLYELVDQGEPKEGTLTLEAQESGLEAYAFTFGS